MRKVSTLPYLSWVSAKTVSGLGILGSRSGRGALVLWGSCSLCIISPDVPINGLPVPMPETEYANDKTSRHLSDSSIAYQPESKQKKPCVKNKPHQLFYQFWNHSTKMRGGPPPPSNRTRRPTPHRDEICQKPNEADDAEINSNYVTAPALRRHLRLFYRPSGLNHLTPVSGRPLPLVENVNKVWRYRDDMIPIMSFEG